MEGGESYSPAPLQVPLETSRGVAACLNKAIYVVDENQQEQIDIMLTAV